MSSNPSTKPARIQFGKLKEVREALKRKAEKWVEDYDKAIQKSIQKSDNETAIKAIQWAFEHMPADEDGTKVIDPSVNKPAPKTETPTGPTFNFGFTLGGVTKPAPAPALPPASVIEVVDITPQAEPELAPPADPNESSDKTPRR